MLRNHKQLKKKNLSGSLGALYQVGSFGFIMAAAIFMGYYAGSYIDRKLGTEPWFMLLLLVMFIIGAFIKFLQSVREVSGKKRE